ncbi:MAG: OB-fold nucleic acid binding domain-containing protein, partial [Gammaproteobacteria bacterium]
PLALLRPRWPGARAAGRTAVAPLLTARELAACDDGHRVRVAGLVLTRQKPGTASGVTFVTLEDETGTVNLIVWKRVGEAQRAPLLRARLLEVQGRLQRQGAVQHVIVERLVDRSALLRPAPRALARLPLTLRGALARALGRCRRGFDIVVVEVAGQLGGVLLFAQAF